MVDLSNGAGPQFLCPACHGVFTVGQERLTEQEARMKVLLPRYWTKVTVGLLDKNGDGNLDFEEAGEAASQRVEVASRTRASIQAMLDQTWKNRTTRDRNYQRV